ncbi:MAG: hypothetical protein EOO45_14360 [Flavobacterium sp.]|nr:MAG: hypothetical protein EOO45_14360 [Flavobacterium sp.]
MMLTIIASQAQTPVKPLYLKGGDNIPGAYYKDIDNDLNKFVGIWQYSDGSTVLNIEIRKKQKVHIAECNAYYDILVGEYSYVKDGVTKVNTLSVLNSPPANPYNHNIVGVSIIKKNRAPVCDECGANERRVSLQFGDPSMPDVTLGPTGRIIIRRVDVGSVRKIEMKLKQTGSALPNDNGVLGPTSFNVPWGTYILTKVN